MAFPMQFALPLLQQLMGSTQVGAPPVQPEPMGLLSGKGGLPVDLLGGPDPKPMAPPEGALDTSAEGGMFNSFFDTLDTNLQSPSKLLGLGLLNRVDPRLGGAGLIGMGLLGRRQ